MGLFQYFRALQRISRLEENVASLTRIVEARDMDWIDMKARCKRLLDRTEKAATRVEDGVESLPEPTEAPNGEGLASLVHRPLTPRQRAVQTQILRTRMGKG